MNEGDESSITRTTRTALRTVVYFGKELVGRFLVDLSLDSCRNPSIISSECRREDSSFRRCRILLQLRLRI